MSKYPSPSSYHILILGEQSQQKNELFHQIPSVIAKNKQAITFQYHNVGSPANLVETRSASTNNITTDFERKAVFECADAIILVIDFQRLSETLHLGFSQIFMAIQDYKNVVPLFLWSIKSEESDKSVLEQYRGRFCDVFLHTHLNVTDLYRDVIKIASIIREDAGLMELMNDTTLTYIQQLEEQKKTLTLQNEQNQKSLTQNEERLKKSEEQVQNLTITIQKLGEENKTLTLQNEQSQKSLSQNEERLKKSEEQVQNLTITNQKLEEEKKDVVEQSLQKSVDLTTTQNRMRRIVDENRRIKEQHEALRNTTDRLQASISSLEHRNKELSDEIADKVGLATSFEQLAIENEKLVERNKKLILKNKTLVDKYDNLDYYREIQESPGSVHVHVQE